MYYFADPNEADSTSITSSFDWSDSDTASDEESDIQVVDVDTSGDEAK